MKKVVSVSIGSSTRDSYVEKDILGESFIIQRIGTDGSFKRAVELIESLDGRVDALGMGGIDLYLWGGDKRYTLRDAKLLKRAAKKTPIVDGSGLKNTLERRVIDYLVKSNIINFSDKRTLITSALDRFGMAETINCHGGQLVIGDIIFALGLDIPIYSLEKIQKLARWIAPIVCQLPFYLLYPTGQKQNTSISSKIERYYRDVDIVAGDFHYIKRYMPQDLEGKIIITNTVTKEDVSELKNRGVSTLVTTTPLLGDRSFGTNVIEAIMVAIMKKGQYKNYEEIIKKLKIMPRVEYLKTQVDREPIKL